MGGLNRQGRRRWLGDVDGAIAIWADVPDSKSVYTDALFLSFPVLFSAEFTEATTAAVEGKEVQLFSEVERSLVGCGQTSLLRRLSYLLQRLR